VLRANRQDVGHDFPEALRLAQLGCQVRRAAWPSMWLYLAVGGPADGPEKIYLVEKHPGEEDDGKLQYCYAVPYLGGAAIGGPPMEDLLAVDWILVEESSIPTREGADLATAALLREIAGEEAVSDGR
jgi:hypothetical protein